MKFTLFASTAAAAAASLDPADYHSSDIIHRDVAVIGGGSSGIYTSVRIRDHSKSVIVVEKQAKLGGHAETYIDANGYATNLGVTVFGNTTLVNDYFNRFKVSLVGLPTDGFPDTYFDFATGKPSKYVDPPAEQVNAAFKAYAAQLAKYPTLQNGFFLEYPVAEDLLLPFGEFVAKYNLGGLVHATFTVNQGYSPLLEIPTIYMFKYLNQVQLGSTANGYLTTKGHNTYALYEAAGKFLGADNVLTSSTVESMHRSANDVKIAVKTPTGYKLIVAKKVVSAVQPTLANMKPFGLSRDERDLFSKFKVANGYYSVLLNNTGVKPGTQLLAADDTKPYGLADLPGIYSLGYTATGLTSVYYGSPTVLSEDEVKRNILADVKRLQKGQGLPETKPSWVAFANHAPFNLEVGVDDIKNRFYEKLLALNGKKSTFYNGAAFQAQDSTVIWQYTEDYILPMLLKSLQ